MPVRWSGTAHPVFVGRTRELAVLEQVWAETVAGARQVVFVGGDPGGGKSRLLAEVATVLHERGAAVLLGSCIEEFGPPYQPFVQPHRRSRARPAQRSAAARREPPARTPTPLTDRLATLSGQRPSRAGAAQHRRRLYDAAVDAFRAAAAQRPLVLVLEDLHWAGSTALQLLGYLVEQTADAQDPGARLAPDHRAGPLAAARAGDRPALPAGRRPAPGPRRARHRGHRRLPGPRERRLGQPGPRATRRCCATRPGATRSSSASCGETWPRAAGRPLCAAADFQAPESVRHTIESRLDRLAAPHREVLELAAVIGEDFDSTTLVSASDWTHDTTLEALDAAVDAGLVERTAGPDGSYPVSARAGAPGRHGSARVVASGARARSASRR